MKRSSPPSPVSSVRSTPRVCLGSLHRWTASPLRPGVKQILLVDEAGPLPPSFGEGNLQGCVDQIGRGLQRAGVIERSQLAPSNLFE